MPLDSTIAEPLDASPATDDVAAADGWIASAVEWRAAVDWTMPFVCDSLTPLYYTPLFRQLTDAQRLYHNQLSALAFNELIVFFEKSFAAALESLLAGPMNDDFRQRVQSFVADERRHGVMWRRLQRASAASADHPTGELVRIRRPVASAVRLLASRPRAFPAVVLVMLTLEEHSIEISRRCGRLSPGAIEPHYAAAYRAHLLDEVRHVAVDRELLDLLLDPLPRWLRAFNAAVYRQFIRRMWLRPTAAAVRVVDALVRQYPELLARRRHFVRALAALDSNQDYRRMMFSPQALPFTFTLLRRYPQFSPDGGST